MIVSASRRTDIPAFYMDWFIRRLTEGYVLTQNPRNLHQIRRLNLYPDDVQFVFWTKNGAKMLNYLSPLAPYAYYIHFTLNPYSRIAEPFLPPHPERIQTFRALAERIGPQRLIWRYDPIMLSNEMTPSWHEAQFAALADELAGAFAACIISFLHIYRCMKRRTENMSLHAPSAEEKRELAERFARCGSERGFTVYACAEEGVCDLLPSSACIDASRLSRIAGYPVRAPRDPHQRSLCGCSRSIDIGVYDSCLHGCVYCYAVHSQRTLDKKIQNNRTDSPLLLGPDMY